MHLCTRRHFLIQLLCFYGTPTTIPSYHWISCHIQLIPIALSIIFSCFIQIRIPKGSTCCVFGCTSFNSLCRKQSSTAPLINHTIDLDYLSSRMAHIFDMSDVILIMSLGLFLCFLFLLILKALTYLGKLFGFCFILHHIRRQKISVYFKFSDARIDQWVQLASARPSHCNAVVLLISRRNLFPQIEFFIHPSLLASIDVHCLNSLLC